MTSTSFHSIVVVGAGAMGCLFAARLTESGASVTLVDVATDRIDALNRNGVTLTDDEGSRTVFVPAARAADVTGPCDLVMLFTKGAQTAAAARSVAHLTRTGTFALTLQNGLGNAEVIAQVFASDHVLFGATDFPADLHGPTSVASHGAGNVSLGCLRDADDGWRAAEGVADLFRRARLHAVVDRNIHVAVWEKAAFNAVMNTITTVTGLRVGEIDKPAGAWIATAIVDEVVAAAAANDVAVNRDRVLRKISFALANHRDHQPSMLQDRLAGRPTEIETINGALVRAGNARGILMPVTATMANLVRLIDAEKRPGSAEER